MLIFATDSFLCLLISVFRLQIKIQPNLKSNVSTANILSVEWISILKIILKSKKETPTQGQIYNIQLSVYNNDISTCRMVFTKERECQLSDCIKALERFYGLSVNQWRELARSVQHKTNQRYRSQRRNIEVQVSQRQP